ncbi:uncharacterized protein TNCV_2070821 [Trichonephila clavipes]|uniref:Uncharacterized protein n=1 Tax=Trichonephila clavipes TaxID=2585209 RepID=A0A8X6W3P7_TRICX|nr:uncharacterized protein TNCV_2070821 [Trichonephila clavipes]
MYGKSSRYGTPNYSGILITNDSSRFTVYVPILLNETVITALWDTGAEKYFISEEVYRKYFSYLPRQKTKDRVVTAQGAPCCRLGQVELQIRIPEFQKKPGNFTFLTICGNNAF